MEPDQVPEAMVQVAAAQLHLCDKAIGEEDFVERRRHWQQTARKMVAAALSVCEAREDWGYVEHWSEYVGPRGVGSPEDMEQWTVAEVTARRVVGGSNVHNVRRSLIRRWVFTTPAEPVPDGEAT